MFLFAVISLLLAFLLGVLVVKKQLLCSRRPAGQETGELDDNQTDRDDVDPDTSKCKTYPDHARAQVNNAHDTSPELNQQIPSHDTQLGACSHTEHLPLIVRNPTNVSDKVNSV